MKKFLVYLLLILLVWGCQKSETYPGGRISPYISIYDLRNLYKSKPVTLSEDNMLGSTSIAAMVVSDHRGGNLPAGLLIVQDARRLAKLRGIAIPLGDVANNYLPGDSVIIDVQGAVLEKVAGMLELTGVSLTGIRKVSSGNAIPVNRVTTAAILANPGDYESTLAVVVKGGFDPLPAKGDVLAGDKVLNDGFGNLHLRTEDTSAIAQIGAPVSANFYGLVFVDKDNAPMLRMRTGADVTVLSSEISIAPVIITGFMSDASGGDGNYEYVQLMATRDIDFAATPFSVVITNNANASTPTGYPAKGWATGDKRSYKFNLYAGTAAKGSFFYVGGIGKKINGSKSTDISSSNWVRTFDYTTTGGDGFGTATSGLMANSGNAFGMAVFQDTVVTADTKPVDVIWVSTGGSLYTAGPPAKGYRIANTDFYDIINPITLEEQPYYRQGSNTLALSYNTADLGIFNMLGGVYNASLGKWVQARAQNNKQLTTTSAITDIEGQGATTLK
ncbi:DUF5689 domain-containing protein [Chitinophaga sancti]|uniref:DUF5689 domain-containing protein n=1 Tax=Chitinophaga sancti TaxID=1004 RepID=A0A1K1NIP3_9BACT|nr:DUF5689 domain-containing protein [Chitinophaga sancti]WQD63182.1 DUF5689 domain-containing protein [Chitinophaga sancti]WQG91192.1 DUF5689 domain-containing protein [Chitinophaga sancti]SFW35304.1 hypothetical protein SAMN05661012_01352 [Chitinophaga sancti]